MPCSEANRLKCAQTCSSFFFFFSFSSLSLCLDGYCLLRCFFPFFSLLNIAEKDHRNSEDRRLKERKKRKEGKDGCTEYF